MGPLGCSWGPLGVRMGPLEVLLGCAWGAHGCSWLLLGRSWGALGSSWGALGYDKTQSGAGILKIYRRGGGNEPTKRENTLRTNAQMRFGGIQQIQKHRIPSANFQFRDAFLFVCCLEQFSTTTG